MWKHKGRLANYYLLINLFPHSHPHNIPGIRRERNRKAVSLHLIGTGGLRNHAVRPVSYTHLDVYKRQLLTLYELDVISGGTAAPVSVAERNQERIQIPLLNPLLPHGVHLLRGRIIRVVGRKEGFYLASVHSSP